MLSPKQHDIVAHARELRTTAKGVAETIGLQAAVASTGSAKIAAELKLVTDMSMDILDSMSKFEQGGTDKAKWADVHERTIDTIGQILEIASSLPSVYLVPGQLIEAFPGLRRIEAALEYVKKKSLLKGGDYYGIFWRTKQREKHVLGEANKMLAAAEKDIREYRKMVQHAKKVATATREALALRVTRESRIPRYACLTGDELLDFPEDNGDDVNAHRRSSSCCSSSSGLSIITTSKFLEDQGVGERKSESSLPSFIRTLPVPPPMDGLDIDSGSMTGDGWKSEDMSSDSPKHDLRGIYDINMPILRNLSETLRQLAKDSNVADLSRGDNGNSSSVFSGDSSDVDEIKKNSSCIPEASMDLSAKLAKRLGLVLPNHAPSPPPQFKNPPQESPRDGAWIPNSPGRRFIHQKSGPEKDSQGPLSGPISCADEVKGHAPSSSVENISTPPLKDCVQIFTPPGSSFCMEESPPASYESESEVNAPPVPVAPARSFKAQRLTPSMLRSPREREDHSEKENAVAVPRASSTQSRIRRSSQMKSSKSTPIGKGVGNQPSSIFVPLTPKGSGVPALSPSGSIPSPSSIPVPMLPPGSTIPRASSSKHFGGGSIPTPPKNTLGFAPKSPGRIQKGPVPSSLKTLAEGKQKKDDKGVPSIMTPPGSASKRPFWISPRENDKSRSSKLDKGKDLPGKLPGASPHRSKQVSFTSRQDSGRPTVIGRKSTLPKTSSTGVQTNKTVAVNKPGEEKKRSFWPRPRLGSKSARILKREKKENEIPSTPLSARPAKCEKTAKSFTARRSQLGRPESLTRRSLQPPIYEGKSLMPEKSMEQKKRSFWGRSRLGSKSTKAPKKEAKASEIPTSPLTSRSQKSSSRSFSTDRGRSATGAMEPLGSPGAMSYGSSALLQSGSFDDKSCHSLTQIVYLPRRAQETKLGAIFMEDDGMMGDMLTNFPPCTFVCGPSGIGKTALATHFLKKLPVKRHFDGTFTLHVGRRRGIEGEVVILLDELYRMVRKTFGSGRSDAPNSHPSIHSNHDALVFKLGWILKGRRVLLLLDDVVNHHVQLLGVLLKLKISLLVTTRSDMSAWTGKRFHKVAVPPLDRVESERLFWKVSRRGPRVENSFPREILDACAGYPITICAAATLLSRKMRATKVGLKEALRLVHSVMTRQATTPYSALNSCLDETIGLLDPCDRDSYQMMGIVPSGSYASKDMLQNLWGLDSIDAVERKIRVFHSCLLMFPEDHGNSETAWGLHGLQSEFVRRKAASRKTLLSRMEIRQQQYLCNVPVFKNMFSLNRYELARFWERVGSLSMAEDMIKKSPNGLKSDYEFVHMMETFLFEIGIFDVAERLITLAGIYWSKNLREDNEEMAVSNANMGFVKERLGDIDAAGEAHRNALTAWRNILDKKDSRLPLAMTNLGSVLVTQGCFDEAEQLYRDALALQKAGFGLKNPDTILMMNQLGLLLLDMGRLEEAESLYRATVFLVCDVMGSTHPCVATFTKNLGFVLERQGKDIDAERMYRSALALFARVFGDMHPDVAMAKSDLGCFLEKGGRFREAEKLHASALAILEKLFGKNHPEVAASMCNLGAVYARLQKFEEAEQMNQSALYVLEGMLGNDHPDVVVLRDCVGL
ncbi:hypothetical protein BSKO_02114 [Bryopsis sp. KO-2023]|nr:hypothetical protein BSKO_02114 [Bryopsis sp. KO-2023]